MPVPDVLVEISLLNIKSYKNPISQKITNYYNTIRVKFLNWGHLGSNSKIEVIWGHFSNFTYKTLFGNNALDPRFSEKLIFGSSRVTNSKSEVNPCQILNSTKIKYVNNIWKKNALVPRFSQVVIEVTSEYWGQFKISGHSKSKVKIYVK